MMDGTGIAQLFAQPAKAAPSASVRVPPSDGPGVPDPSERVRERRGGNNPIQNLALKGSLFPSDRGRVLLSASENGKDEFGTFEESREGQSDQIEMFPPRKQTGWKRNFHPAAPSLPASLPHGRHEGFPIISSDHLSQSSSPLRSYRSRLSDSLFDFRFLPFLGSLPLAALLCRRNGIICQVVISEHFYILLSVLSGQGAGRQGGRSQLDGWIAGARRCVYFEPLCRAVGVSQPASDRDEMFLQYVAAPLYTALFLLMAPFEPCNDGNLPLAAARIANSAAERRSEKRFLATALQWPPEQNPLTYLTVLIFDFAATKRRRRMFRRLSRLRRRRHLPFALSLLSFLLATAATDRERDGWM